jgi:signal peptidase II
MEKKKIKIEFGKISIIMLVVMAVLITLDLVTKSLEETYNWNFSVIPGFIVIRSGIRNSGAAFSFLAQADWGQAFLIIVTFIMLAALIAGFIFLPERFVILKLAVAMLIAGAIGNLVDRIAFNEVRDFIYTNMIFTGAYCNIADYCIVIGVIIAIIDMLFLNEWAVFPLTQKAKNAQAKYRAERDNDINGDAQADTKSDSEGQSDDK